MKENDKKKSYSALSKAIGVAEEAQKIAQHYEKTFDRWELKSRNTRIASRCWRGFQK